MQNYSYQEIRDGNGKVWLSTFSNSNVTVINFQDGTDKVIFHDGCNSKVVDCYVKLMGLKEEKGLWTSRNF